MPSYFALRDLTKGEEPCKGVTTSGIGHCTTLPPTHHPNSGIPDDVTIWTRTKRMTPHPAPLRPLTPPGDAFPVCLTSQKPPVRTENSLAAKCVKLDSRGRLPFRSLGGNSDEEAELTQLYARSSSEQRSRTSQQRTAARNLVTPSTRKTTTNTKTPGQKQEAISGCTHRQKQSAQEDRQRGLCYCGAPKTIRAEQKKAKTAAFLQDLAEDQDKLYGELNKSETPSEHCFRTSC